MATLIKNAWVDDQGWGPGFGNADRVPPGVAARIDADAWDQAPDSTPEPDPYFGVPSYEDAVRADHETHDSEAHALPPVPELPAPTPDDDETPDVAEDLRTQLRALGVTPDGRWGIKRLREEIEVSTVKATAEVAEDPT